MHGSCECLAKIPFLLAVLIFVWEHKLAVLTFVWEHKKALCML